MNKRRSRIRARPLLKFLKEEPGYGLVQPVTHLENRIEFSTKFPENHCCMLIILWYNIIRKGKESLKRRLLK